MFGKYRAPEFSKDEIEYVNTNPYSLAKLKGNIVLLDFWTYCCINCIHTLPDLAFLEEEFKNDPVQVIGVHTAKFDEENDRDNVLNAIGRYEINHPVILDKKKEVSEEYGFNAWPTLMLIDSEGYIRKTYSGEGHKQQLIGDINSLLEEGKSKGTLSEKYLFSFLPKPPKPLLYYPGKISIQDDRIAIANSNRNLILYGNINDGFIEIKEKIGNGNAGNEDGDFSNSSFFRPQSVLTNNGVIYVADTENFLIRKIDLESREVSTLKISQISSPWDLAIHSNNLYIALAGSHQLGKIDLMKNKFSIFAGNRYENIVDGYAPQASLAQPSGLSIYKDILFFADSETSSIRYIILKEPYIVRTIVGYGLFDFGFQDGSIRQALFQHPLGLCANEDKVYIADTYNSAIRVVDLKENEVSTLISSMGHDVCMINNKECNVLGLNEPSDVKLWKDNLIISDTNNHLIRKYNFNTKELSILEVKE